TGLLDATAAGEGLGEPEGAGEEGALTAGKAIGAAVAVDVGAFSQGPLDGGDGAAHPGVAGWAIAVEQAEEETGVQLVAGGGAYVTVQSRAEAVGVDERGD